MQSSQRSTPLATRPSSSLVRPGSAPSLARAAVSLALLTPRLAPNRPACFGGGGPPLAALRDGAAIAVELSRLRREKEGPPPPPSLGLPPPSTPADALLAVLASRLADAVEESIRSRSPAPVAGLGAQLAAALRGAPSPPHPRVAAECGRVLAWCADLCAVEVE